MPSTPLPLSPELLGPVYRLSMEQIGSYVTFLQTQWATDRPIPDDIRSIIFLLRVTPDRWLTDIRPALLPFFEIRPDGWWHHRLESVRKLEIPTDVAVISTERVSCSDDAPLSLGPIDYTKLLPPGMDLNRGIMTFNGKVIGTIHNIEFSPPMGTDLFGEPVVPETKEEKSHAVEREFAETFWPAYPIKAGKTPALKAFIKARRKTPLDQIMAGVQRYRKILAGDGAPSVKYAQGWLNDERWNDQLPAAGTPPRGHGSPARRSDEGVSNAPAYGTPEYHALQKKIGA